MPRTDRFTKSRRDVEIRPLCVKGKDHLVCCRPEDLIQKTYPTSSLCIVMRTSVPSKLRSVARIPSSLFVDRTVQMTGPGVPSRVYKPFGPQLVN